MTILEELASLASPGLAARIAEHRKDSTPRNPDEHGRASAWDNRKTWDNWAKKEPPFSKKTHYFGNKN